METIKKEQSVSGDTEKESERQCFTCTGNDPKYTFYGISDIYKQVERKGIAKWKQLSTEEDFDLNSRLSSVKPYSYIWGEYGCELNLCKNCFESYYPISPKPMCIWIYTYLYRYEGIQNDY